MAFVQPRVTLASVNSARSFLKNVDLSGMRQPAIALVRAFFASAFEPARTARHRNERNSNETLTKCFT